MAIVFEHILISASFFFFFFPAQTNPSLHSSQKVKTWWRTTWDRVLAEGVWSLLEFPHVHLLINPDHVVWSCSWDSRDTDMFKFSSHGWVHHQDLPRLFKKTTSNTSMLMNNHYYQHFCLNSTNINSQISYFTWWGSDKTKKSKLTSFLIVQMFKIIYSL